MNEDRHNPEMVSLISPDTVIKVSSTLDKSVGKKNLVDGSPETCWTSQQGLPQTITLILPSSSPRGVIPKLLSITFQGGFVGRTCAIHARTVDRTHSDIPGKANWRLLTYIYPEDVNRKQTFTLPSLSDAAFIAPPSAPISPSGLSTLPATASMPSHFTDLGNTYTGNPTSEMEHDVNELGITALRLTFETSSDFFGRVTVYDLDLKGYLA
ncbi:galactose-binding like protein [Lentinula edodes]|uniref:Galactose-binding like protein n=1 Tax=Lentinula edodes TaxID=5353 RepID=A0A1Q3EC17_LENED|nr:galactose-binding like protein [Lentinula edodes]